MNGSHVIEITLVNSLGEHLTVVTCPNTGTSALVTTDSHGMGHCTCGKAL